MISVVANLTGMCRADMIEGREIIEVEVIVHGGGTMRKYVG